MTVQAIDTQPQAEEIQLMLLRQASIAKRVAVMRSLSRTTIQLSRRAIHRANPHYTPLEVNLAFVAYHYGEEMAQRLRRYLEWRGHASN